MRYVAIKNVISSLPHCGGAIPREGLVAHNTSMAEELARGIKDRFPAVTIIDIVGPMRSVILDIPSNISVNKIEEAFDCTITQDGPMRLIS